MSTLLSSARPRLADHFVYATPLHQLTLFPYATPARRSRVSRVTLSVTFRAVLFQKKRSLPFFLARELLTQQKPVVTLSKRNRLAWKVRKGRLVGCRVTLRGASLTSFLELLSLTLPRREKLSPLSCTLQAQRRFHEARQRRQRALVRGQQRRTAAQETIFLEARRRGRVSHSFSLGELLLLYPFERGLGVHPDVHRLSLAVERNTGPFEERSFLRRSGKLPVLEI